MNKRYFETIKQAAAGHIANVDRLIPDWQRETARDVDFSDRVKNERMDARKAAAQRAITDSAERAKEQATTAVDAMRADFKKYMTTTSDPGALQSLQAHKCGCGAVPGRNGSLRRNRRLYRLAHSGASQQGQSAGPQP